MREIENSDANIPSKLKNPADRHERVTRRINVVKKYALSHGVKIPEEVVEDEHFWYRLMEKYYPVTQDIDRNIPNKNTRRAVSFKIAVRHTKEILTEEKEKLTDGLTGAWSRKALENYIDNIMTHIRENQSLGLIFIDIDDFKKYNTEYMYSTGDVVLMQLTNLINQNISDIDMLGRYGGDEFVVVMPRLTHRKAVLNKAKRLKRVLNKQLKANVKTNLIIKDETLIEKFEHDTVTVSAGVGILTSQDKGKPALELLDTTSKHIHEAKGEGKDMIVGEIDLQKKV